MKRIFALFPGQGSQKVGMGRDLFQAHALARDLFARADEALGFSLSTLCFEGPAEALTRTAIAQPAILTVSTICFELFRAQAGSGNLPVIAAGHSLGEYSALVAAGALTFEDAVRTVHRRGTYMQEAVPVGTGKMLAVLGMELAPLEEAIQNVNTQAGHLVEIANLNAPGQIVVAGYSRSIDLLKERLQGTRATELPVSAPFHCALMKPAEERLRNDLLQLSIAPPAFPIIANFTAREVTQPEGIRDALIKQVCGRVRWIESVQYASETFSPSLAVEFGAGAVLQGLLKRILPSLTRHGVDSADAVRTVLE